MDGGAAAEEGGGGRGSELKWTGVRELGGCWGGKFDGWYDLCAGGGANADEGGVNKFVGGKEPWDWAGNMGWEGGKAVDDEEVGGKDDAGKAELEGGKFVADVAEGWNEETRGLVMEGLRGGVTVGGAYVWLPEEYCWEAGGGNMEEGTGGWW